VICEEIEGAAGALRSGDNEPARLFAQTKATFTAAVFVFVFVFVLVVFVVLVLFIFALVLESPVRRYNTIAFFAKKGARKCVQCLGTQSEEKD